MEEHAGGERLTAAAARRLPADPDAGLAAALGEFDLQVVIARRQVH